MYSRGTKWYTPSILNKKFVNTKRLVEEKITKAFCIQHHIRTYYAQNEKGSVSAVFKSNILDLLQAGKSFAQVSNGFLYSMLLLLQWVVDVLLLEIVRDVQTNVRLDV